MLTIETDDGVFCVDDPRREAIIKEIAEMETLPDTLTITVHVGKHNIKFEYPRIVWSIPPVPKN